jgi:hypothetical protein
VISEFDATVPLKDQCYPGGMTYVWRLLTPPTKQAVAVTVEIFRFFVPSGVKDASSDALSAAVEMERPPPKISQPLLLLQGQRYSSQQHHNAVAFTPTLSPIMRTRMTGTEAGQRRGQPRYQRQYQEQFQEQQYQQQSYQHQQEHQYHQQYQQQPHQQSQQQSKSPPGFLEHENTKALRRFYETNQGLSSPTYGDDDGYGEEEEGDWDLTGSATLPLLNQARDNMARSSGIDGGSLKRKVRFASDFNFNLTKSDRLGVMDASNRSFGNAAAGLV